MSKEIFLQKPTTFLPTFGTSDSGLEGNNFQPDFLPPSRTGVEYDISAAGLTMPVPTAAVWTAVFLAVPSPGSVVRYLQRRTQAGEELPVLLLSDAVPPHGLRALSTALPDETAPVRLSSLALRLSLAFSCRVTLLYQSAAPEPVWGYAIWDNGTETERAEFPLPPRRRPLLERLPGARPTPPPPVVWAERRGLPLSRVPGAMRVKVAPPVVDYMTVAKLDQRGLLIEDVPRLYRFDPANPDVGAGRE
jgi:hypothetical protein